MQIRQLEYFVAVSEQLNFTKAARQFFISQTAVTQQIKALEDEIGVRLFDRNNRRVALTPAGKTFLEDAKAILRRTRDALLPSYITDTLSMREKVIAVPIEGEEKKMTIIAAWHKENDNPALTKFLDGCLLPAIENERF